MKIYYSSAFTANAYYDLKGRIEFDAKVCGNEELLQLLMLHLGIYNKEISPIKRATDYYKAFRDVVSTLPKDNLIRKSFEVGQLSVSSEFLRWRDQLVLAFWKPDMDIDSERIRIIAEVEKSFSVKGEADYWMEVIEALKTTNPLPEGSELILRIITQEMLPPYIRTALECLSAKGLKITEQKAEVIANGNLGLIQDNIINKTQAKKLDEKDKSFSVLKFPDDYMSIQYAASIKPDTYDVYINGDSKNFDDLLMTLRQPTSGSSMQDANPQIAQLFMIGLSLFNYPMNVNTVLAWLLMPKSPIKRALRSALARTLTATGGIRNEEWNEAINKYLKGRAEEEEDAKELKERKRQVERLEVLLPIPDDEKVKKSKVQGFLTELYNWAVMQMQLKDIDDNVRHQYFNLCEMTTALSEILTDLSEEEFDYAYLENCMRSIYTTASYEYTEAYKGSRYIVSSPGNMASEAGKVMWMDMYNYTPSKPSYEFLNPEEIKQLTDKGCKVWDSQQESALNSMLYYIPLLSCKEKFCAMVAKKSAAANTTVHPLYTRLSETFGNFDKFVDSDVQLPVTEVDRIIQEPQRLHIDINNADMIEYREHESYSSLDMMIQYPLEYVMQYLANFRERPSFELDPLYTVKGTVAHKVIETLCMEDEEKARKMTDIEALFNDKKGFGKMVESIIWQNGALLLLKENINEKRLFVQQLHEAVAHLLDTIKSNNLEVESCEHQLESGLGFKSEVNCLGFIDMKLHYKENIDKIVVFDFKWTTSSSRYIHKITSNTAMQLAVYKTLIKRAEGQDVVASGYFAMPYNRLLTADASLRGKFVTNLTPDNNDDLMAEIEHSYDFRKSQFERGYIETADDTSLEIEGFEYMEQKEALGLYPLEANEKTKTKYGNVFSNYKALKGGLK